MSKSLSTPPSGHRRRVLAGALIAVATALILTVPIVLWALRGSAPSVSGVGPVPPSTSSTPGPTTTPTPTGPAPDGRIPMDELRNATIDVPAWPTDNLTCLAGRQTFVNGEVLSPADDLYYFERHMIIQNATRQPIYGDVDNDGAQETVVLIDCVVQGGSGQVVALDRDAAGNIVTKGTVIAMTGEIRVIDERSLRVLPDGTVEVSVGDYMNCCGSDAPVQWQVRGYGWIGDRFHQVNGPSAFPVNQGITETALTAGPLVLGPPDGLGTRHGTVTLTVTYLRGGRPDHLSVTFSASSDVSLEAGGNAVDLPTPSVGHSATYTFAFRKTSNAPVPQNEMAVALQGIAPQGTAGPNARPWMYEWVNTDNYQRVPVTLVG